MQKTLIIFAILLVTTLLVNAQNKEGKGIYFSAVIGTQTNNFKKQFVADIDPQLYPFSIGASGALTKNNFVIGFEFLYSNASKKSSEGEIQYIGFNNTLSFGYNISKSKIWRIEPNIGVVLNNNQLIVQNKTTNSFQNLTNNQICGNIGLNIKAVAKNGIFTGVKLGYVTPFSGNTEWKNKISDTNSGLNDNVGVFYIQLILGGFLDLTKSN